MNASAHGSYCITGYTKGGTANASVTLVNTANIDAGSGGIDAYAGKQRPSVSIALFSYANASGARYFGVRGFASAYTSFTNWVRIVTTGNYSPGLEATSEAIANGYTPARQ